MRDPGSPTIIDCILSRTWIGRGFTQKHMSHDMTKPTKWVCAQRRLTSARGPVWSESSLSAWRNIGSLATHSAHSDDSDQPGHFVGFAMSRLICRMTRKWTTSKQSSSLLLERGKKHNMHVDSIKTHQWARNVFKNLYQGATSHTKSEHHPSHRLWKVTSKHFKRLNWANIYPMCPDT